LILAAAVQFGFWADGCVRFVRSGYNLPSGPLGVLCYLPFVPIYWLVPARLRAGYLWISSLALALVTIGPAYALTMTGLAAISLAVVRLCGRPGRQAIGTLILAAAFLALAAYPQPFWLPHVDVPVYFYFHWAGIAYLFLRAYHVLADVAAGKLVAPAAGDFLAYLLFAPTLRMGPIYRYGQFYRQMAGGPAAYRSFARAAGRFLTGAVRLAAMALLIRKFPQEVLYTSPQALTLGQVILYAHAAIMAFYLWMSGYVDWSIAVGRLMGFDVPDNFNYPWRSASIGEFWRRWHITLSTWLKDYLFVPLVRHRWHYFWSFTVTFLFCGLWHGMYVSYLLWGLSQGIGLAAHRWWSHLWQRQRENQTALYVALKRARLVQSPFNTALCWLVTFEYLIACLNMGLEYQHAGLHIARRILALLGVL